MKTLVVFYSLEGNAEFIADVIGKKLQADIVKLETVKPFPKEGFGKFFKGGMSVVFKSKPKLVNQAIDLSKYDNIIIGTPVWASGFASPINTFINKYKFSGKKLALFLTSGGPDVEKCFEKLKIALKGNEVVGEIDFIEPIKTGKDEATIRAEQWAEGLNF
ncbi:MAG: flavodoxin [Oscillospiraceae bacterium]|nr:flavodoxin [Oscillospiraceae bacterium]